MDIDKVKYTMIVEYRVTHLTKIIDIYWSIDWNFMIASRKNLHWSDEACNKVMKRLFMLSSTYTYVYCICIHISTY